MSKIFKIIICLILSLSISGCSNNSNKEIETVAHDVEVIEDSSKEESAIENVPTYPITLNEDEIYNWIDTFCGGWVYGDRYNSCRGGDNSIEIWIQQSDVDDLESAYNIYQYTGCCNDGIYYNISSIIQADENTYEVHLDNYDITAVENSGVFYQNYTLLPTDTYIIRKGNDDKTFYMQFKGLNIETYKSFPDAEYMSNYEKLYLKEDEWYEFKLFWKDDQKVEY